MRQRGSLKWSIDSTRVLFPSALPESARQSFTDVARGGRQPQESFLSLKQQQRPK